MMAAGCGGLLLLGCGGHDHAHDHGTGAAAPVDPPGVCRLPAETLAKNPLGLAVAAEDTLRPTFTAPAQLAFAADRISQVVVPVRGRVVELAGVLGARVRAGDLLAVLDSQELGELQSELLQQTRAGLAAAPVVALAQTAWQRGAELWREGGLAEAEVWRRESDYRTALQAQQRAEAAAAAARQRLALCGMTQERIEQVLAEGRLAPRLELRSPRDGLIAERAAVLGAWRGPDDGPLFTLVDPDVLWVVALVPEASAAEVVVGTEALVRALHAAGPAVSGRVTFAASQLDPATRSLAVRVELAPPPEGWRVGMFAEVELPRRAAASPCVAVPEAAVQAVDGQTVVFVPLPGDAGAFLARVVEVGPAVAGRVPVRAGLASGETFVAEGAFLLKAQAMRGAAAHEH